MIAALDVGGSSVKAGLVDGLLVVGEVVVVDLDHTASRATLVDAFATAIEAVAPTDLVAIAMPDPFDHAAGVSLMHHKFASLYGVDLSAAIVERLGRRAVIRFCNDAAAAVVGEAVAGAGHSHRRVLGITLGTGLGAAFAVDGRLVEQEAGITVGDAYRASLPDGRLADDAVSARAYVERLGAASDPQAEAAAFGRDLGTVVAQLADALGADMVVVGGGGADSFGAFAPSLRQALAAPVEPMSLGRAAPLIGAAHICFP